MPKTRNRRRFRKTPYAYSHSRLTHYRALYHKNSIESSTVISRDTENGCKTLLLELAKCAPLEGTKTVTKYNELLQDLRDAWRDVKASENADGSQSSTHSTTPQVSLSTGTYVNDGPAASSVTTRAGYNYHEYGDDDAVVVPELLFTEDDATVPLINKPSAVTKEKETNQSEACGLNCHNDCHKKLTVGISYFSSVDMCEECVLNIEQACSQCQLAYRTKKMVSKAKLQHL